MMIDNGQTGTYKRRKRLVLALFLLLPIILGVIISLTLLNEDWLKTQVEKYVHEKYQTDINIESLEFNPWEGHALLSGITLNRTEQDRQIAAAIGYIELDVQLIPLVFRDIAVTKLVIYQPDLKINVQLKPEPMPEDTLTRLQKVMGRAAYESVIRPLLEAIIEVLEVFVGHIESTVTIDKLIVHEGYINYAATGVEAEPFTLEVEELEYSVMNINAKRPMDFAFNADITAKIVLSETQAEFSQHFSQEPITLSITDIDLGYLDRYLQQEDILKINNGNANVNFLANDKTIVANIALQNLKLMQNTNAVQKDFAFIPVDKLVNYVNKTDGNLNLEFEIEKSGIHTSQDLQFVVIEAWEGVWKQILRKVSSDKLQQLKERGTQKLMDFFNKKESAPKDSK